MAPFVVTDYTVTRDKYIAEQPLYANYDIDEASAVITSSITGRFDISFRGSFL
jgi:hypothetical protein